MTTATSTATLRPWLLGLAALASGCTAVRAEVNLLSADAAVLRAREADAEALAPYEYTLAVRYLEKAKEENGYASYKVSEELARAAAEFADQSIIAIEREGRGLGIDEAGSDLSDMPMVPREPPPPPSDAQPPPDELPLEESP